LRVATEHRGLHFCSPVSWFGPNARYSNRFRLHSRPAAPQRLHATTLEFHNKCIYMYLRLVIILHNMCCHQGLRMIHSSNDSSSFMLPQNFCPALAFLLHHPPPAGRRPRLTSGTRPPNLTAADDSSPVFSLLVTREDKTKGRSPSCTQTANPACERKCEFGIRLVRLDGRDTMRLGHQPP
jgi:hypothetical protein